jgi:hypothetical protein
VGQGAGDLAGDEGFATNWAFVVEGDAVAGIQPIGFAVVDGDPVGVELGDGVGASWVEGGGLLRGFLNQAVEFAGSGLVETGFLVKAENADGFEDAQCANTFGVGCVFRGFEADGDMAHGGLVVDFVGLDLLNDADEVGGVGEVAVMEGEVAMAELVVLVEVVYAARVEQGRATFYAVNYVTFIKEKFGQIGTVLVGVARDQCCFHSKK